MVEVAVVQPEDYEALATFMASFPGVKARTVDAWRNRLRYWWDLNPAWDASLPRGWMLRDDGRIGGFFGSVALQMQVQGEPVRVFGATSWRVLPEHRGRSLGLKLKQLEVHKENLHFSTTPREDLLPLYFIWTTHRTCNFSCTYCDDHRGSKYPDLPDDDTLDTEQGRRLLRVMRSRASSVYFAGGEPTLRKDLPELVREVDRRRHVFDVADALLAVDGDERIVALRALRRDEHRMRRHRCDVESDRDPTFAHGVPHEAREVLRHEERLVGARKIERPVALHRSHDRCVRGRRLGARLEHDGR